MESKQTGIQEGVDPQTARQQAQAAQEAALQGSLGRIKHKFIVFSGKGGVGKTSCSVNLAIALSSKGYKVGLMDVDLHGPDVPRMLGLSGMLDLSADQKLKPLSYGENLKVVSIEALTTNKDDAVIWRGPIKYSAIRQFLADVDWGELDFLIIDSPPGTGDEPLTIAQTIKDARAIIVTTPQEISLADVRKSISFCKTVKMEIFGVIENMSGFTCPHCGKSVDLFGSGGGQRTAEALGLAFLGRIPFDQHVVSCGDAGTCLQDMYHESAVTQAFAKVAERMGQLLQ